MLQVHYWARPDQYAVDAVDWAKAITPGTFAFMEFYFGHTYSLSKLGNNDSSFL